MLDVAVLGAGYMGRTHLECYLKNSGCRVTHVFDKDIGRAEKLAGGYGIKATDDINEIMESSAGAVDICLPTFLHMEYSVAAANAGKHVLCEKPMAANLDECDAIIEAAKKNGIKYMVAHVLRFWPEYNYVNKIVRSGELGRPVYAIAGRSQPVPLWSESNWIVNPSLSLGGVVDFQIHDLDFISWTFGEPAWLRSVGSRSKVGGWDQVVTVMQLKNGFNCCIEACALMPQGYPFTARFKVLFTDGCIEYDCNLPDKLTVYAGGIAKHPDLPKQDGYSSEIDYFVGCIESGRDTEIVTPEDARDALMLALKSRESLDEGKTIIF